MHNNAGDEVRQDNAEQGDAARVIKAQDNKGIQGLKDARQCMQGSNKRRAIQISSVAILQQFWVLKCREGQGRACLYRHISSKQYFVMVMQLQCRAMHNNAGN